MHHRRHKHETKYFHSCLNVFVLYLSLCLIFRNLEIDIPILKDIFYSSLCNGISHLYFKFGDIIFDWILQNIC